MDKVKPAQAFSFDDNVSYSWKLWLKHFDFHLAATEKDTKNDKIKTSIFLTCIGQKGRQIYETFTFEPGDEMKLAPVLHKFSEYCNPRKKIIIPRHNVFTYRQQEGQNFYDFVTELKMLSSECQFRNLQDSLIKDMIVCDAKDNSLRDRPLQEYHLTLFKAISAGHVIEKVHEIEKDESDEPSDQSDHEFFIETGNIQDSAHINQIKNENSDWPITVPSNGIPVPYKIDTVA